MYIYIIGASRGAGVQACDGKRDRLWVHFVALVSRQSVAFISVIQHVKPIEFDGK